MQVPRLSKGKGIKGPEPYGCFNTGTAPVILHSRSGLWLVGPENEVDGARERLCFRENQNRRILKGHRNPSDRRRWVYVYRTRGPAVRRFQELCEERGRMNAEMRSEHARAARDAASSDPETSIRGALTLGDF